MGAGTSRLTGRLTAVADAIRAKTEGTEPLTLEQMASAIEGLKTQAVLTFSTSRGTAPSEAQATFARPTAPTASGYTFADWYRDAGLTELFDFSAPAESATVYAKWRINQPTVSHPDIDGDGTTSYELGTVTPAASDQTVYYSADNKTWSTTCPKQSAGGTYTTYWKVTADGCDDLTGSFTTTISTLKIVTFAGGTDDELEAMIAAADAGKIKLSDYWHVGDTRQISISAMSATGVGESHVAQTRTIVLMDAKGLYKDVSTGKAVSFIYGLRNGLANGTTGEYGYMNSSNTNSGGWASCARRTWCNNVFFNALPGWLQRSTKTVSVLTANGSGSTTSTSQDKIFLPAEKEIFGSNTYADSTAEASLVQWDHFKTSSNRIKYCGDAGSASSWWERSPYSGNSTYFCVVISDGTADYNNASRTCTFFGITHKLFPFCNSNVYSNCSVLS